MEVMNYLVNQAYAPSFSFNGFLTNDDYGDLFFLMLNWLSTLFLGLSIFKDRGNKYDHVGVFKGLILRIDGQSVGHWHGCLEVAPMVALQVLQAVSDRVC